MNKKYVQFNIIPATYSFEYTGMDFIKVSKHTAISVQTGLPLSFLPHVEVAI